MRPFDRVQILEAFGAAGREPFLDRCPRRLTAKQVDCMLEAQTAEALDRCEPEIELRPSPERPGEDECVALGAHIEDLALRNMPQAALIADLEAEIAELEWRGVHASDPRIASLRAQIDQERARKQRRIEVGTMLSERAERACRTTTPRSEVLCQLEAKDLYELSACES